MEKKSFDILKQFYKDRKQRGESSVFDYDDEGNMVQMDTSKKSIVQTLIALNEYRSVTHDEWEEMEIARKDAIAVAVKRYDDAVHALHTESLNPNRSDKKLIALNREVAIADEKLQEVRFPMRYIEKLDSVKQKDIHFTNDARIIPYRIHKLHTSPFVIQDMFVRIGKEAEKPLLTVAQIKKAQQKQAFMDLPVILITEEKDDYSFLSMDWPVSIIVNGTTYQSAGQAFGVEMAKRFGDQAHVTQFMSNPEHVRYTSKDVPGDEDENKTKWAENGINMLYSVLTTKFMSYPSLALKLIETGNAHIGAVIPGDMFLGIGVEGAKATNPLNWTGLNILGKTLSNIRNRIKTEKSLFEEEVKKEMQQKPAERIVRGIRLKKAAKPASTSATVEVSSAPKSIVNTVSSTASDVAKSVSSALSSAVSSVTSLGAAPESIPASASVSSPIQE